MKMHQENCKLKKILMLLSSTMLYVYSPPSVENIIENLMMFIEGLASELGVL